MGLIAILLSAACMAGILLLAHFVGNLVSRSLGTRSAAEPTADSDYSHEQENSAFSQEERAEWDERQRKYQEEFEASNPDGPPISEEEHTEFAEWFEAQKLPAIRLDPAPAIEAEPDGSRIGGPAWLAEDQSWPVSRDGVPMEFLAQLDFAQLPALEGFPSQGVIQFFVRQDDDLWGMGMQDHADSDVGVLYRDNGAGVRRMPQEMSVHYRDRITPFYSNTAREQGIGLAGEIYTDRLDYSWEVEERFEGNRRRPGIKRWDKLLDARFDDSQPLVHHIGGYPAFTQGDFRKPGHLDDYDTVLLGLTSDDYLQWGDVGEANFLIRRADLSKRDFSKVIFWWDCS